MPTSAQDHIIFTVNGVIGACNTALVLMKHPEARIQITSDSHIDSAFEDIVDTFPEGTVHVCGIGCTAPMTKIAARLKALPKSVRVNWYAGQEHPELLSAENKLTKVCRTVYQPKTTTSKIIRDTLRLKRSDALLSIIEILEDAHANKPPRSELHNTWVNRIEASNHRFFYFGDDNANEHTMRALSGNITFGRDIDGDLAPFIKPENRLDYPLGSSKQMMKIRKLVGRIGPIPQPALILGPTGSGKDVVARSIHKASRRKGYFIAFNCAVLGSNPQIAESRLFGYLKGAFTGADSDKRGAFQDADDGTLFLDEIGELSLEVQAHLLRVLDNGTVTPVGSTKERKVDVRIVAATHRNLHQMVADKEFREDLLYRLNVLTVSVPPLRERPRDMRSFSDDLAQKLQKEGYALKLGRTAWEAIEHYDWPGNVRQFLTVLRRAAYMGITVHDVIEEEKRMLNVGTESDKEARMFAPSTRNDLVSIKEINKTYARKAFLICDRNITHTAKALDIASNTLRKYIDG